jgi:hypothetical protein
VVEVVDELVAATPSEPARGQWPSEHVATQALDGDALVGFEGDVGVQVETVMLDGP